MVRFLFWYLLERLIRLPTEWLTGIHLMVINKTIKAFRKLTNEENMIYGE